MIMILLIAVTVLNVAISAGFSLAGVLLPRFIVRGGEGSHTAKVFALYSFTRSAALLLVVLGAASRADSSALIWLGTLTCIILLADAAVGIFTRDQVKVWVPLAMGTAELVVVLLAFWLGA